MPNFVEAPEFKKDLHKLRRFRSIQEDFERFKKVLNAEGPKNLRGAIVISNLGKVITPVYKAKKFRCKDLKSSSEIRVVYTYNFSKDEVFFIEIYFKGNKENHDLERIRKYVKME